MQNDDPFAPTETIFADLLMPEAEQQYLILDRCLNRGRTGIKQFGEVELVYPTDTRTLIIRNRDR